MAGQIGEFAGVPVITYTGDNAEAIVEAMGMKEGDMVMPGEGSRRPIVIYHSALEQMREAGRISWMGWEGDKEQEVHA
jgi:hypothetical protein